MAQFAIGMGGTSFDQGYSVAVDSSGNSYVTGYFDGTVDFDPGAGTTNLTGAGSVDVYIVKYDSSGALVWAKNVGGTNTDQSYRRPRPDISLFYAETPVPKGQGQTLYADGIGAYAALPDAMKARIAGLDAIHVSPGRGRSEQAALAGGPAPALDPRDTPQRQPIVRIHPVTGEPALYLCEAGQLDWFEGPVHGMEKGPHGDGAKLVYELMSHYTDPRFVHVQDWSAGDLIVYDNRCTIHSATWFDADAHSRRMWRTTVRGNPGAIYAGEARSWLAAS